MSKLAKRVVEQAQAWIGKKESDGSHKMIIDFYNSHKPLARGYAVKYTDSWCATFVSAVAIKLRYTDIIPTECSCQKMIELFKKLGVWVEDENRTPNVGDIIFYDWQDNGVGDNKGWSDHVGIVEKVTNGIITVIEGNISNAVGRRTLTVNGKYIRGYAVPKYDIEAVITPTPAEPVATPVATPVIAVGDTVSIAKGATYYNSTKAPGTWIINKNWIVKSVSGNRVVIDKSADGKNSINSPIDAKYLTVVKKATTTTVTATSKPVVQYYNKYTGASGRIDEVLKAIGVPSAYYGSWSKRVPIAKANDISLYIGTSSQNTKLISLAKQGKLKKA